MNLFCVEETTKREETQASQLVYCGKHYYFQ